MATHGLQYRQRIGVGKHDLKSMSGHDNQVEAPVRLVVLPGGLDPLNPFRVRFPSGHSQHRRCWINTCHPVTTLGQGAAKRARTATQVEHPTWGQSGKSEVEVGILRPRVNEIVNLGDLSVLIVHTFVAPSPRLPQSDVTVVGQSSESGYLA